MQLKLVVAGPKGSGKTVISNFLSGQTDKLVVSEKYSPTAGVRILEFEGKTKGVSETLNIELWDCSGDDKYANFISVLTCACLIVCEAMLRVGKRL